MKNILATFALFISAASMVNASSGKITFVGSIVEGGCSVSTLDSSQFNIIMPAVSEERLRHSNKTAGRTPISINLAGCKGRSLNVHFDVVQSTDIKTGRLKNTSDSENSAKNVQIQLVNENGSPIKVESVRNENRKFNTQFVNVNRDSATLNYAAEYYATGAVSTGDIKSAALYTIVYH